MNTLHKYLFFIAIISFAFTSCENDIAVVNSVTYANQKQLPSESGKNVEIMYSDSARVRAKLTGAQLDHYLGKKNYIELPKGVQVVFYDANKKEQTHLTADYGIGFDSGNGMDHMEVKRHVVVVNEKGDKLETEHLTWNAATKQIYTDVFVKISTKTEIIWGTGLKANQDFSDYEITHPQGSISVDEKQFKDETGDGKTSKKESVK